MKRNDYTVKRCTLDILFDDAASKKLSISKLDGFRKKNLKLWSQFQERAGVFRLRDISFISDEQDVLSIVQRWKRKFIKQHPDVNSRVAIVIREAQGNAKNKSVCQGHIALFVSTTDVENKNRRIYLNRFKKIRDLD
ncbi:MAG: hypothetical protein EZS28_007939 [Streblomastix strix]|uniref:Uncharacterized protein n=1 Tax=Streblomastix strix TaxID=222440 RepID=A0A5J4WP57_9EUKA|nr:MAG: hypothetical protein EZS28_007939 [Streblomastix strix]